MKLMWAGLGLWVVVHLIPSMAPGVRQKWQGAMGEKGYMASFALLIVLSLVLIVFGWRSTVPEPVYAVVPGLHGVAITLLVLGFILFGAAQQPTRIKRLIRHPQLTGLIAWSVAHLMLNGDSRSVTLFGVLGVWAVVSIVTINRRDGEWVKPEAPSWGREVVGLVISLAIFALFVFIHPYIAGVPVR